MRRALTGALTLLVLLLVPIVAFATNDGETSLDQWWNTKFANGDTNVKWGMTWSTDLDKWDYWTGVQGDRLRDGGDSEIDLWVPATGGSEVQILLLEEAGLAGNNELWWYDPFSAGTKEGDGDNDAGNGLSPVFTGTESVGSKQTFDTSGASFFSFMLKNDTYTGKGLGNGFYGYKGDWGLNTGQYTDYQGEPDSVNNSHNKPKYTDEDHLLVAIVPNPDPDTPDLDDIYNPTQGWKFEHGSETDWLKPGKFVLAWEDRNHCPTGLKDRGDGVAPSDTGQNVFIGEERGGGGDPFWEPDYNDMVIAYADAGGAFVPEPMSASLLCLAGAGIGVAIRKRRRNKA